MEVHITAFSNQIGKEIPLPSYATAGSGGLDLRACLNAPLILPVGASMKIPTGIGIALPSAEYVGLLFIRSGLSMNHGITLTNGVGVIDSDYRGEILLGLRNQGEESYTIQSGDRVAQLVILPIAQAQITLVDQLPTSRRGHGGFGSTGTR